MNDINLFPRENSIFLKKISSKSQIKKDDKCDGYFISANENEARKIIQSQKNKIIAIDGGDDSFNRRAIETLKINYLVFPEKEPKKDSLKQRDSGLNHYLAKECARKKIELIINLDEIKNLKPAETAKVFSRIIQNIKLCRKTKCKIRIASFAKKENETFSEIDRRAIGESLGMSTIQSKESIKFN